MYADVYWQAEKSLCEKRTVKCKCGGLEVNVLEMNSEKTKLMFDCNKVDNKSKQRCSECKTELIII